MTRRLPVLALSLALLVPGAALAVLPPTAYLEARREAGLHMQVKVTRVRPAPAENACRIEGKALSVWKGGVRPGEKVKFSLSCRFASTPVMPGPTLWSDPSRLKPGLVLEGFFDTGDGGLRPARDQVFAFRTPSAQPRCSDQDYACREETRAP